MAAKSATNNELWNSLSGYGPANDVQKDSLKKISNIKLFT